MSLDLTKPKLTATGTRTPESAPPLAPPLAPVDDWADHEPFDSIDVPTFPVHALSPWLRDWAASAAEFCQVPVDMPAAIGLAAASLAASRRFHVRVRGGWEEPTNLWIVVAASPAERKSPIFKHATMAVYGFLEAEAKRLGPSIRDRQLEREVLSGQFEAAKAAAIKNKPYEGGDARLAARELGEKLASLEEISVPSLLADDCTPEALAVMLSSNEERMGLFSAEGGPFEMMAGRYSERGSNFEIYLKAHSGDHHLVNRIKREPIQLSEPLLTMALTVQPSVIAGLHGKDGFRGRGLLARVLYSLPKSPVGKRSIDTEQIPDAESEHYNRAMLLLLLHPGEERMLQMSEDADRARARLQLELEPRLGPDGDLHAIGDWAGKFIGAVCRIAGVLHVADHALALDALPDQICVETFNRAAEIGRYFLAHARAAFDAMGADEDTELAKRVWAWVCRKSVSEFSERDARRATHSTPESISGAMAKLVSRNLVRSGPPPESTGGRPASQSYQVSPRAGRP
jgi:replicative DNA helicase